ncbi:MAG: putative iron-sulfur cluster-binding metallochaperone [Anaerolineae bacterium]
MMSPRNCCTSEKIDRDEAVCNNSSASSAQGDLIDTCPVCNQRGKKVEGQTVKAMLALSLAHVSHGAYLFCSTPTCPVVYFSADGMQHFTIEQVRERVYQKDPDTDEVLVCYCFRYSVGDIRAAVRANKADSIVEAIKAGVRAGQCACDIRNPQGSCCLGNVHALIKRFQIR